LPLIILIAFTYFIGFFTAKLFKTKNDVIKEFKSKENKDTEDINEKVI
jgi:Na+-transporting methylmalonyl-CoA/oxaloacetate decarboxylase gamma subunit